MNRSVTVEVQPNLALVKYWGKKNRGINIPATSSLGITLEGLSTRTTLSLENADNGGPRISINGESQPSSRFSAFFDNAVRVLSSAANDRELFPVLSGKFNSLSVDSVNSFPTAAGLASSSSGLGALAYGLDALLETGLSRKDLSAMARTGSGSAARTLYGGFIEFREGAKFAEQIADHDYWPDFRVILLTVSAETKKTSSRSGMNAVKGSSPYFPAWVKDSRSLFKEMRSAVLSKDIEKTGTIARLSYMRMFSTMFSADPPLIYWQPESVRLIHALAKLRSQGIGVWETMDAGPQVKVICEKNAVDSLLSAFQNHPTPPIILTAGKGPEVVEKWK